MLSLRSTVRKLVAMILVILILVVIIALKTSTLNKRGSQKITKETSNTVTKNGINETRANSNVQWNCQQFFRPVNHVVNPSEMNPLTQDMIKKCRETPAVLKITNKGKLLFESSAKLLNLSCCLHETKSVEILKHTKNGSTITTKFEKICRKIPNLNGRNLILNDEFPHVTCEQKNTTTKNELYLSNIQMPDDAELKMKFWKSFKKFNKFRMPPSIFILGLSSISSNQAKLHLSKTHRFLLQQKFTNHQHYIKSGNNMVENIYAVLSGHLWEDCEEGKNKAQKDGCESIWSKYVDLNYVTLNGIQDDTYTHFQFNISNDFTLQPLLKFYEDGMMEHLNICFQYDLLREIFSYTSKFMKHFFKIPYIGNLWLDLFANQGKDTLQVADAVLFNFFSSIIKFLHNTIVIVISDDGFSHGATTSTNEILESHFPILYTKIPSEFKKTNLRKKSIISAKNIYFSLLKNLESTCQKIFYNFESTSLKITLNTKTLKACGCIIAETKNEDVHAIWEVPFSSPIVNCAKLNIPAKYCFCSAHLAPEDQRVRNQVIIDGANFVLNSINDYIDSAFSQKERVECTLWVLEANGIIYNSTVLVTSQNDKGQPHKELFLFLRVQPFDVNEELGHLVTHFSARVRLDYKIETSDEIIPTMTLIDFPHRRPTLAEFPKKYSKCVENLRRHRLSSICYCKRSKTSPTFIKGDPLY